VTATAQGLSIMGFSFVMPFLPLFIKDLGVHGIGQITMWAGILAGGTSIPMALTAPVWGVLADRYGRKVMVVRAALSAGVLVGLMGFAQNVWQLLFLRMMQGALTGTVSASQALVASQSPREKLGFSLGMMQTAVFVGTSCGPLLGGVVADAVGFRHSFLVAGVLLVAAGVVVLLFVKEERIDVERDGSAMGFWEGMGDALKAPALLPMIGAVFAVQFAVTVIFPILPQFIQILQGAAGHVATATGLVFTGAGIAGAVSSIVAGRLGDRIGYKRVLITASIAGALFSIPQYFVTATWQIFALRVVIGLALGAVMPSATALIATLVPAERRGTAYGLSGSATSLGFAAGPLTAAAVVGVADIRTVFLTAAVLLGVIAAWVALMVHPPQSKASPPPAESGEKRISAPAMTTLAEPSLAGSGVRAGGK
jgi:MFS transporter, DHA1 family, multidrug resistance protein